MTTPTLLTMLVAAIAAALIGAAIANRRHRAERNLLRRALCDAHRRIGYQRSASRRLCDALVLEQEARAVAQGEYNRIVADMRIACEDALLWSHRDRNRMAARLALYERPRRRSRPAIVWPVFVQGGEN